jgi:hypothetical protein
MQSSEHHGQQAGDAMRTPTLELLLEYYATLKEPAVIGAGPFGVRQIFDVTGGAFHGPRLRGRLLPSGGDWLLIGADGFGRLDVRGTCETDDGALIYVSYFGILQLDERVMQKIGSGGTTEYGEIYFFTQPRFETGDPRYAWLNSVVAVAQGKVAPQRVDYRVYHLR